MTHTQTVSLDLGDILRKRIDECAKWKRDISIPKDLRQELEKRLAEGESWDNWSELSEEENKLLSDALFSRSLGRFLEAKEKFVIPEDVLSSIEVEIFLLGREPIELTLAYQDFYAYQFLDMLNDNVRRALMIRNVFSKKSVPEEVKLACAEAYRCFLYGLNTASIVLCRAIVEASLKLALKLEVGTLETLNEFAHTKAKLISSDTYRKIDTVRKETNRYAHRVSQGKEPPGKKTLNILGLTQDILRDLSASGGQK